MTRRPPRSATTAPRRVEQASGHAWIGRSALAGAARGVLLGLLFGLVSAIFFTSAGLFLGLVLFSVTLGVTFGVIAALDRSRRLPSVAPTEAERYDAGVDIADAARAPARAPRHIGVPVQPLRPGGTRGRRT